MSVISRQLTAAEDLLRMPGNQRRELVRGELREMPPAGFEHGGLAWRIASRVGRFVDERRLGQCRIAETGYLLQRDPDTVRAPDFSFVSAARLSRSPRADGFFPGAPDLAVEVISPSETHQETEEKVNDYLAAGAQQVWVVNPLRRTVTIHRPDAPPVLLNEQDSLDGGALLPGFSLPIADIFT